MNYSTDPALTQEVLTWLKLHQPNPEATPIRNEYQEKALGDLPPTALAGHLLHALRLARSGPLVRPETQDIPLLP